MEDIRNYVRDEEDPRHIDDRERVEYSAAPNDDEVPFHIPRD